MKFDDFFDEYMLANLRAAKARGELPGKIAITTYKDDDTYKLFRPDEYEPRIAKKQERAMIRIAAKIAREFPEVGVYLVPISAEEYTAWRKEMRRRDSPATRAMYAAASEELHGKKIDG